MYLSLSPPPPPPPPPLPSSSSSSFSPQLLFDRSLSSTLVISYNAKAIDGQLCLEASPTEGTGSVFAHSPHATMLEVSVM